ncbi:MAG: integrase core domain-containing protein [Pseudomonadota bacterium]
MERLWREEGLPLPERHKKRKRLYHHDASIIRQRPLYANHIWSVDLVHDRLSNGLPYKMLTVLDEYTREALCVMVATRMGSSEVLTPLLHERGAPSHLRSDSGPHASRVPLRDIIAEPLQAWLKRIGTEPIRILPGSPWENGYNERSNGTLRREVLDAEWFATTRQAQAVIDIWLKQYNHIRPHEAIRMRPPVPETL